MKIKAYRPIILSQSDTNTIVLQAQYIQLPKLQANPAE
jgi:hypothetical protein